MVARKIQKRPVRKARPFTRQKGGKGSYVKARPTRFKSASSYAKSRMLSTVMNTIGETKLHALNPFNSHLPSNMGALTDAVWQQNYIVGGSPSGYSNFDALDGMTFPVGTGPNDRVGKYMYLKKTTVNLKVALTTPNRLSSPTRFRCVVYKAKRNNTAGVYVVDPGLNLFIDDQGREFGTSSSIATSSQAMTFQTAIVNRKNYDVLRDFQFVLTPPVASVQGGSNLVTPISQTGLCEKMLRFQLGHYKKVSFNSTNEPSDLNYSYCISLFSMPVGSSTAATNNWSTSLRGTVSALDN